MLDLMFALAMLVAIPMAIARPFAAYLLWGWTALMVPSSYLYGFMAGTRVNLFLALLTFTLIVLGKVSIKGYVNNRMTWFLLLFLAHASAAMLFGYPGNPFNVQYYVFLVKVMAFTLLMPLFVKERMHIHAMVLVMVFGLGLHGVLDGLKTIVSAGAHNMYGPRDTVITDRNHLSTALAMLLPLVYYLHLNSQHRWIRWLFLGAFAVIVLAIMGGRSRGGFLAISVVGCWLVFTSRAKMKALFMVVVVGGILLLLAPEEWTSRMNTIQTAGEDESFVGRLVAWRISSALALSNPVFGGGFHALQIQSVWDQFKAEPGLLGFLNLGVPEFDAKAAHSIYFEVLGDLGFVGLAIFLFILFYAVYSRFSIKGMAADLGPSFTWARDLADMLMLSVVAYLIGGAGVSLSYFELIYMIVMLMEMLRMHVAGAAKQQVLQRKANGRAELERTRS
ncbi:putative O-glycosylation ligase, exosortase A system-associated [Hydrogenophaga sp.]|uniref:putative O-glycosylation ligase, exosortase A system-associated n=1 Tax=Hydrogenophaga sp. TaxID=1904254 RepID=UPI00272FB405|nr:putative O-glycosylation ligase, exosortase A system-associated [Hydrogenophaga sp.]MDP1684469.1 putative O-glycosylation ligase, exosortase A system-associated [Hydrogenophaga sp.]